MSQPKNKYLSQRINSFKYAFQGIAAFLQSEPHARLHAIATVAVIAAGCWCKLPAKDWINILIVIGLVWTTEMFNTVVEKIMDHLSPDYHPKVKWIKDVAAGAVLVAAIIAAAVGAIIFIPLL
ncbi:diacylglycerol kinase family protein [Chitinophaga pendula]|uniref:diacylglycerol kinase family protein n=1 Tax=Chitinophaga TaxID=79328 RepID=UPI000BAF0F4D|nr:MULTISPECIES: diacylglycerol kinase family protein [Chitinophaga]ASZ10026.1 diacylglycerol kinase [Chitinophaga sp. MD30]UCJ07026.1 diacylglycerol kinase family protein [Chitinophaga pendula]